MKRVGMVIGTVPEKIELYKKLHADETHYVRDLLKKYHYQNFNIFITEMPCELLFQFGSEATAALDGVTIEFTGVTIYQMPVM